MAPLSTSDRDRIALGPTSGVLSGWIGIACAVVIIVMALLHGVTRVEWRVIACACFGVVACWALMLRPRVIFDRGDLVLRNMLSDAHIPYTRLRTVSVRSVTSVTTVEGDRYVGVAVGRTRRDMAGAGPGDGRGFLERRLGAGPSRSQGHPATVEQVPDAVERLAESRMAEARGGAATETAVRRRLAVPEAVGLLVTAAGVVVAFLA